jgi:NitT/TauT family transport system substrate-binding protein
VSGGYYVSAKDNASGLYVKKGTTVADLKGQKIASSAPGNVSDYGIAQILSKAGLSLSDVHPVTIPGDPSMKATALKNGAVAAASGLDSESVYYKGQSDLVSLGPVIIPGWPMNMACIAGPGLLKNDRPAGVAFFRAYVRTIDTYLQGDYKKNPSTLKALATDMQVPESTLTSYPSEVFDWLVPSGIALKLQSTYASEPNVLTYTSKLPESKIVDRSLFQQALGVKAWTK